jgi:hypothetical protein
MIPRRYRRDAKEGDSREEAAAMFTSSHACQVAKENVRLRVRMSETGRLINSQLKYAPHVRGFT